MSVPFKSMTAVLTFFLYTFILTSSGANHITSPFLVPFTLNISNDISIGSVLICSSFTNCLLISVYVHPESTSTCNYNFFLFFVLIFVCMFNFLSLLFLKFGITYQFWGSLCTEVHCIIPTPNLQQNSLVCYWFLYLYFLEYFYSLSFVPYSLWLCVLFCHIYNTF